MMILVQTVLNMESGVRWIKIGNGQGVFFECSVLAAAETTATDETKLRGFLYMRASSLRLALPSLKTP